MDIAIVTGASSSLGLAISRRLIQLGFKVYGLGGDYRDCSLQNVNFRPVPCDLADPIALEAACLKILEKDKGVCLLVNNAKFFGNQPFDDMSVDEMERILRINLLCPLILMRVFGKSLRALQGYLIQLGAPFAESSNGGAVGAASAGGLKWMGEQLFNEYRDQGVKVCHLSPEPNRTRDARMRIRRGARPEASIDPEAIAQAIEQILQSPFGNVVTEMVIRPLRIDEPVQDPVRKIPYPEPQPIPYTVPREFIEAEEQLEEDEWKEKQERKRKRRSTRKTAKKQAESETKKTEPKPDSDTNLPKEGISEQDSGDQPRKPRRRARRKPKPQRAVVGFHDTDTVEKNSSHEPTKKNPEKKKGEMEKPAKNRPSKKRPARRSSKETQVDDKRPDKRPLNKTAKKITKKAVNKIAKNEAVEPEKLVKRVKKVDGSAEKQATQKKLAKKKATKKAAGNAVKKVAKKRAVKKVAKRPDNEKQTS